MPDLVVLKPVQLSPGFMAGPISAKNPTYNTGPIGVAIPGPKGQAGASGVVYTQSTAAATWTIDHNIGREPQVIIYNNFGEEIVTDVYVTTTQVVIIFAAPMAGKAILV